MLVFKTKKDKNSFISLLGKVLKLGNEGLEVEERKDVYLEKQLDGKYCITGLMSNIIPTRLEVDIDLGLNSGAFILNESIIDYFKNTDKLEYEIGTSFDEDTLVIDGQDFNKCTDQTIGSRKIFTPLRRPDQVIKEEKIPKIKKFISDNDMHLFDDYFIPSPVYNLLNSDSTGEVTLLKGRNEDQVIMEIDFNLMTNGMSEHNVVLINYFKEQ